MTDKTIGVFLDYFLPGYKGGGTTRSVTNLLRHLNTEFKFHVFARDRDSGDTVPYPRPIIIEGLGNHVTVDHLSPEAASFQHLGPRLRAADLHGYYLNSFFTFTYGIRIAVWRHLGLIPRLPLLVAPRGEFSPAALGIRTPRKRLFIALARATGLYRDAVWHASGPIEAAEIRRVMGRQARIAIAPEFPPPSPHSALTTLQDELQPLPPSREKTAGEARIVFLSRICPIKNLLGALEILGQCRGNIHFDIYGPIEDRPYWDACLAKMRSLPAGIEATYHGHIPFERVHKIFSGYHAFLFPTFGENFGNVIIEALVAGCPLVISDRTPWRNLATQGVGWDLPLTDPSAFAHTLAQIVDMGGEEFAGLSKRAFDLGQSIISDSRIAEANRGMFHRLLSG